MDNFRFDMTCEGEDALVAAFNLVFAAKGLVGKYPKGGIRGITHYAVRPATEGVKLPDGSWQHNQYPRPLRMVFFNHYEIKPEDGKVAFPFKMDADGAADFARRWLSQTEYGHEPDHDGDNGKGWRLYNEGWGHIDGDNYGVIAVAPVWAMYGK